MQALHFGAGNIGRGFIGKLLSDSGFKVFFADINASVIEQLNTMGSYNVRIVSEAIDKIERVINVAAISSADENAIIERVKQANLVTTAVGPNVLTILSSNIANSIAARLDAGNSEPLNIIACENMVRASSFLKEKVYQHLPQKYHQQTDKLIGFVDSAVDRIVPPIENVDSDLLAVTVEEFCEWIVDKKQFKGVIPDIVGMTTTDNLMAFVERKLFTLNTGHATTAYLGKLNNIHSIKQAIETPNITQDVRAVMQQSGNVLIARYDFEPQAHAAYIEKILNRFANPYLKDDVDRVGREPLRKLSATDRLIKPLLGTLEYQLQNDALINAIAAALCYRNDNDQQARELAQSLANNGLTSTLEKYSGLTNSALIAKIEKAYKQLAS